MEPHVVVRQADEGDYWAEVPSIPGCATQGDGIKELLTNIRELRGTCPSTFETFRFRRPTGSSRSRCEGRQRKAALPTFSNSGDGG